MSTFNEHDHNFPESFLQSVDLKANLFRVHPQHVGIVHSLDVSIQKHDPREQENQTSTRDQLIVLRQEPLAYFYINESCNSNV